MAIRMNRDRYVHPNRQRYHGTFATNATRTTLPPEGSARGGDGTKPRNDLEERLNHSDQDFSSKVPAQKTSDKSQTRSLNGRHPREETSEKWQIVSKSNPPVDVAYTACAVTMVLVGLRGSKSDSSSSFGSLNDEILITQYHTVTGTMIVFKGLLQTREEFTFKSHRLLNRPFALSIFVNGMIDCHLSTCCEEGYLRQCHVLSRKSRCQLVSISGGQICEICQYNNLMDLSPISSEETPPEQQEETENILPVPMPPNRKLNNTDVREDEKKFLATGGTEDLSSVSKDKTLIESKNSANPGMDRNPTRSEPKLGKIRNEGSGEKEKSSIKDPKIQKLLLTYLTEFIGTGKSHKKKTHARPTSISNQDAPTTVSVPEREKLFKEKPSSYARIPVTEESAEPFRVIWSDKNVNTNEDANVSKEKLRAVVNALSTFDNIKQTLASIETIRQQKVFLIISGDFATLLFPVLRTKSFPQLNSIYIFCVETHKYKDMRNQDVRVRGIFSEIDVLCNGLRQDIKDALDDLMPFYIISTASSVSNDSDDPNQSKQKEEQKIKFLYSQLHRDLLFTMECPDDARSNLISYCLEICKENPTETNRIREFEQDYHAGKAVKWYTRHSFLYRFLSNALRCQDVAMLYNFHFFIKDLHEQIERLYRLNKELLKNRTLTVYRGFAIDSTIFNDNIRHGKGNLIAFDYFLSTSLLKKIGTNFALMNRTATKEAVLFEIRIEPEALQRPFASIRHLSVFEEEHEVLFSIGTVFRIDHIDEMKDQLGIWNVVLTAPSERELQTEAEITRRAISDFFDDIREFLQTRDTKDHNRIAASLANIGNMYYKRRDYQKSLTYFQEALGELSKCTPHDPLKMATYETYLAMVYDVLDNWDDALASYQKAFHTFREKRQGDDPVFIDVVHAIGHLYFRQEKWKEALDYYLQARTSQLSMVRPPEKPDPQPLAASNIYIALVYQQLRQWNQALNHLTEALSYLQQYLVPRHPMLASVYNHIGAMYFSLKNFEEALKNHLECLAIERESLPANHIAFVDTYRNIASTYEEMNKFQEACTYYLDSLGILQKQTESDPKALVEAYENVSKAYKNLRKFKEASDFAQQAIEQSKRFRNEHDVEHQRLLTYLDTLESQRTCYGMIAPD